jgi:hypothetical protein
MKQGCKYHPTTEALWYCRQDGLYLCSDCAQETETPDGVQAHCFICNEPVQSVASGPANQAFWHILAHFVRYPLMLSTLLLGLVPALASVFRPPTELVGLAVVAAAGVPLAKYGFHVMVATGQGQMRAPALGALGQAGGWDVAIAQWLLFLAATAGPGAAFLYLGVPAGIGIALLAWLLVPAALITAHSESNAAVVLNPGLLFGNLLAVGGSYFVAWAVLFAGFLAVSAAMGVLVDLLPDRVGWGAGLLTGAWFWLATMHLLGYLVCQNAGKLGVSGAAKKRTSSASKKPEETRRRSVLLKAGYFGKVVKRQQKLLEKKHNSLELNDDYFKLLNALNRRELLLEHACDYLGVLLNQGQEYRIPGQLAYYQRLEPGFKPDTGPLTWDLAKVLAENNQQKQAIQIMQDLHKRAPTWNGLPDAYLYMAELLAGHFNLSGKAKQYIRFVEQRYRDQAVQEKARACREKLGLAGG